MMQSNYKITKDNVFQILKDFAKFYRKELGKVPGEIILVGGGSILLNYDFRKTTQDLDVILNATDSIRDIIKEFADANKLPFDWMNTDFIMTSSYSPKLYEVSKHYCSLNNGTFEIRTISGIYLIAMKIKAFRLYRNDISDIIGILLSEKENGNNINLKDINDAFMKLYSFNIPHEIEEEIKPLFNLENDELGQKFKETSEIEMKISKKIVSYINNDANINAQNVDELATIIRSKMKK